MVHTDNLKGDITPLIRELKIRAAYQLSLENFQTITIDKL